MSRSVVVVSAFMSEAAVARLAQVHATAYEPDLADRAGDLQAALGAALCST